MRSILSIVNPTSRAASSAVSPNTCPRAKFKRHKRSTEPLSGWKQANISARSSGLNERCECPSTSHINEGGVPSSRTTAASIPSTEVPDIKPMTIMPRLYFLQSRDGLSLAGQRSRALHALHIHHHLATPPPNCAPGQSTHRFH